MIRLSGNILENTLKINLHYIRAAIEAATGTLLTIDEVKAYLLTEGLATQSLLDRYTFRGYGQYYGAIATESKIDLLKIAEDMENIRIA